MALTKAEKRKARLKIEKAQRELKLKKIKEDIKNSTVHGIKVKKKDFEPLKASKLPVAYQERNSEVRFVKEKRKCTFSLKEEKEILSPEMEEREKKAQEEIERKKKRTAPAYNKGAYQYITDETDLSHLGRKI